MDNDEVHTYVEGTAVVCRADGSASSYGAKLCGCGKLLIDGGGGQWYQPSLVDWDGQLERVDFTFDMPSDRSELPTSTGPGGSVEAVPQ